MYTYMEKSADIWRRVYTYGEECVLMEKSVYTYGEECTHMEKSVHTCGEECVLIWRRVCTHMEKSVCTYGDEARCSQLMNLGGEEYRYSLPCFTFSAQFLFKINKLECKSIELSQC